MNRNVIRAKTGGLWKLIRARYIASSWDIKDVCAEKKFHDITLIYLFTFEGISIKRLLNVIKYFVIFSYYIDRVIKRLLIIQFIMTEHLIGIISF